MKFYTLIAESGKKRVPEIWSEFNKQHVQPLWDKPAPEPEFLNFEAAEFALWLFITELLKTRIDILHSPDGYFYSAYSLYSTNQQPQWTISDEILIHKKMQRVKIDGIDYFISKAAFIDDLQPSDEEESKQFTYLKKTALEHGQFSSEAINAHDKIVMAEYRYWNAKAAKYNHKII